VSYKFGICIVLICNTVMLKARISHLCCICFVQAWD